MTRDEQISAWLAASQSADQQLADLLRATNIPPNPDPPVDPPDPPDPPPQDEEGAAMVAFAEDSKVSIGVNSRARRGSHRPPGTDPQAKCWTAAGDDELVCGQDLAAVRRLFESLTIRPPFDPRRRPSAGLEGAYRRLWDIPNQNQAVRMTSKNRPGRAECVGDYARGETYKGEKRKSDVMPSFEAVVGWLERELWG